MKRSSHAWIRWTLWSGALVLIAGGLFALLRPKPIEVDAFAVERGPLIVTLDEQAETRSHDRFVVAAPVAGRVLRVDLHEGDPVAAAQTVAELTPAPLGERETQEIEARLAAARALQREAEERLRRTEQDLALTRRERARLQPLADRRLVAEQALDQARTAEASAEHEVSAARHRVAAAAADVDAVRASLLSAQPERAGHAATVLIRTPVSGRVLRVPEKSDRVVAAGTPLVIVGDLSHLEVLIEMLSTEAVKVQPDMLVLLDGWGGNHVLHARVSAVEPFAFTKVSALGVEEKRTNVIAQFVESPVPLGDGYRLNAHIVTFSANAVLKAPASAVFPCGQGACVFLIENGLARRRAIAVGHRSPDAVEVLGGLAVGSLVIGYPPNEVNDGSRVSVRTDTGR
jgi:HlyD family secretion protein